MGLDEVVRELTGIIKKTTEFNELKQVKAKIESNKNLKSELDDFNRKQMMLYSGNLTAREKDTRITELNKKYEYLSQIPEVDRYLKAVQRFNQVMSDLIKSINESIESSLKN